MEGVPNCTLVSQDCMHTVVAVANTQVMQSVLDSFKQWSSNSYPQYKKPKSFGERGNFLKQLD